MFDSERPIYNKGVKFENSWETEAQEMLTCYKLNS